MAKRKSSFHTKNGWSWGIIQSLTYKLVEKGICSEVDYQRALRNGATHRTISGQFVARSERVN